MVVFVVCPAGLADGLVGHLLCVLALFPLHQLSGFVGFRFAGFRFDSFKFASFRFAGFRLALGHGALLAGLDGVSVGRLATLLSLQAIHRALLFLLAEVLLFLLLLSIAARLLFAVLFVALLLLAVALVVLLAVALVLALLAVVLRAALLAVLPLLLTVLRHPFGQLGLQDQVTS